MNCSVVTRDDADLRTIVLQYLNMSSMAAQAAESAAAFYELMRRGPDPDIVIIDLGLPDQDGSVLVEYTRRNSKARIIVMTARNRPDDRVSGYESGADLYLTKPTDLRELVAALRNLCQRKRDMGGEGSETTSTSTAAWQLCLQNWCLQTPDGTEIRLTAKEMEILDILNGSKNPCPRHDLREKLYPEIVNPDSRALDALIGRLREKIFIKTGCSDLIVSVHGSGYTLSRTLERCDR